MLENLCPQAFVYTQSADFVRKDLTYCLPALFVIMYIITLSNVIHSFKFSCEVNVGTGLQQQKFSLLKEQTTSGAQVWRFPYCQTTRDFFPPVLFILFPLWSVKH